MTNDAQQAAAELLVKQAAAKGKLIEVGWLAMLSIVVPADASETQV